MCKTGVCHTAQLRVGSSSAVGNGLALDCPSPSLRSRCGNGVVVKIRVSDGTVAISTQIRPGNGQVGDFGVIPGADPGPCVCWCESEPLLSLSDRKL